jgi:hypothetical protein
METWKIVAVCLLIALVAACTVFVAWLYPEDHKVQPFRRKSK